MKKLLLILLAGGAILAAVGLATQEDEAPLITRGNPERFNEQPQPPRMIDRFSEEELTAIADTIRNFGYHCPRVAVIAPHFDPGTTTVHCGPADRPDGAYARGYFMRSNGQTITAVGYLD